MYKKKNLFLLPISVVLLSSSSLFGTLASAGSQGVDIYCVMRNGGNDHDSSWQAAYQAIKSERGGLFKISPKQAATIIVQQVVGSPDKYDNCVQYLGDLFPKEEIKPKDKIKKSSEYEGKNKGYVNDRYSY